MSGTGYMNPMRNMERRLAPDYAQREMRNPGLRSSGLGSLKHTMPHLRRISAGTMRMAGGGSPEALLQALAAARPYGRYDPDPQRRQMLQALRFSASNPDMRAIPGSTEGFPYAAGGDVDDGGGGSPAPQDLMQPENQQSPDQGDERQVVLEAMAALEGQAEDPEEALAHFIDTFGPRALKDLQQMVEAKHRQADDDQDADEDGEGGAERMPLQGGDEEEGEEDQLAGAGGGLLNGPGTGQSDEIEASTPSGRPVLLSDGEYVFDAPTVAALGDGSTNAGARRLDELRKQIRRDAYGHDKQAKPMRAGGIKL